VNVYGNIDLIDKVQIILLQDYGLTLFLAYFRSALLRAFWAIAPGQ